MKNNILLKGALLLVFSVSFIFTTFQLDADTIKDYVCSVPLGESENCIQQEDIVGKYSDTEVDLRFRNGVKGETNGTYLYYSSTWGYVDSGTPVYLYLWYTDDDGAVATYDDWWREPVTSAELTKSLYYTLNGSETHANLEVLEDAPDACGSAYGLCEKYNLWTVFEGN